VKPPFSQPHLTQQLGYELEKFLKVRVAKRKEIADKKKAAAAKRAAAQKAKG